MSGEARDLAWYLGSATDIGRWWVAGDQLCHKWFRWFNAEPQCMRIAREGRIFRWRSQDGNTGTAAIAVPAPAPVQASTLLALPRVFPKRVPEPAPAEAPPALASPPPRLQELCRSRCCRDAAIGARSQRGDSGDESSAGRCAASRARHHKSAAAAAGGIATAGDQDCERAAAQAGGSAGSAGRTQARGRSPVPGRQRSQRRRAQHPQRPVGRLRRRRRVAARQSRHCRHERVPLEVVSGAASRDERMGQQRLSRSRGAVDRLPAGRVARRPRKSGRRSRLPRTLPRRRAPA